MIYVCADLHGMFKEFVELLKLIEFSADDELYIIGDIIDRGPASYSIFEYIIGKPNIHMIRGNHEQMLIDYVRNRMTDWFMNGGYKTITSIPYETNEQLDSLLRIMAGYFESLPLFKQIEVEGKKYFLVHAGIDYRYPATNQDPMTMLWIREGFLENDFEIDEGTIIFGHTPNRSINHSTKLECQEETIDDIIYYDHKMGIDGGAYFGGQINCIRLNDLKAFKIKV